MISYNSKGEPDVHFDIIPNSNSGMRKEVRMSLEDWITLTKSATTIQELRVKAFMFKPIQEDLSERARKAASSQRAS